MYVQIEIIQSTLQIYARCPFLAFPLQDRDRPRTKGGTRVPRDISDLTILILAYMKPSIRAERITKSRPDCM